MNVKTNQETQTSRFVAGLCSSRENQVGHDLHEKAGCCSFVSFTEFSLYCGVRRNETWIQA